MGEYERVVKLLKKLVPASLRSLRRKARRGQAVPSQAWTLRVLQWGSLPNPTLYRGDRLDVSQAAGGEGMQFVGLLKKLVFSILGSLRNKARQG